MSRFKNTIPTTTVETHLEVMTPLTTTFKKAQVGRNWISDRSAGNLNLLSFDNSFTTIRVDNSFGNIKF
jgi:hypothetical protein